MPRTPVSPSVVELDGPWEHQFLHTRGVRLHAAVMGEPSHPLIVCIHGSVGGWFDYRHIMPLLAQAGFYVAAIDLRGYGMSDKPPADAGQDIRTLVGDITGVIQSLGKDNAILLANDSGAALAWTVAAQRPQRVRAVVSISGAHPTDIRRGIMTHPWDFGWFVFRTVCSRLPMPLLNRAPLGFLVARDFSLNTARADYARVKKQRLEESVRLRTVAASIDHSFRGMVHNHRILTWGLPYSARKAPVSAPVLFIHADQKLWGPVISRAQRRAQDMTCVHIPGTKNLPHLEEPAACADEIISWLRAQ